MATTLSSVRTGRWRRFSTTSLLIKLLVGYDYAVRQGRKLAHLAAGETRAAKHLVVFGERVCVPAHGTAEHHHGEHGVHRRRDAVLVGNELSRHHPAARRHRGMNLA